MPSKDRKAVHPNIYKCRRPGGTCGHWWIPESARATPSVGVCPKCGYEARLRCGAAPRGGRTEPCGVMVDGWGKRCGLHGAKALKGAAAKGFRHGLCSKYLPAGMARIFEEAMTDPHLKSLDTTFALLTVARVEALKQLSEGQCRAWEEALAAAQSLSAAIDLDSLDGARAALPELLEALRHGAQLEGQQERAWTRVLEVERQRTQAVNVEARRMQAQQGVVPVQQMTAFAYAVVALLREFLSPESLSAFVVRLRDMGSGQGINEVNQEGS